MSANTEFVTSFFMFVSTHLHAMSQGQDVTSTLIVIQYDSLHKLSISQNVPCMSHTVFIGIEAPGAKTKF